MVAGKHIFGLWRALAWGLICGVTALGCAAVGPDYATPKNPAPAAWQADLAGGEMSRPHDPQDLANWWKVLNDPVLADLEQRAIAGNTDLKQALWRVREARARRGLSAAALYPALDMSAAATRSGGGDNSGGQVRETYAAGLDAAWELDLFGGLRRAREAADADLQAGVAGLYDVLVSLTAEVGLSYLEMRTYQFRLSVAEANASSQQETFELIRDRYTVGLSSDLAVQQARYNLESTRSRIPGLRTGLAAAMNRLAVLTGQPPGGLHQNFAEPKAIPVIPVSVAVGIPADMVRRRPDIRQAERELAARTARVGVAVADLYPALRLNGTIGFESADAGNLLQWASRIWSFGPRFSWKVFDAGAARNTVKIQEALQEQALIAYESAVLSALEEVENGLIAYAQEQLRRERLVKAVDSARQAEKLSKAQYMAGVIDFSNVLEAQRTLLSFQDQLAQSEGAVTSNLIRLYKALGGGWAPSMLKEAHFEKDDIP